MGKVKSRRCLKALTLSGRVAGRRDWGDTVKAKRKIKSARETDPDNIHLVGHEPRWPSLIAGLAVGGLYMALPAQLTIGPRWLLLAIVCSLQAALWLAMRRRNYAVSTAIGHSLSAVITLFMIASLGLLIQALPSHKEQPTRLLGSAVALWITNVVVFASWYWRLDAGGPHQRAMRVAHTDGAFLFPQMLIDKEERAELGEAGWSPVFVDYLFLAFNTSTALSPTDTAILSRWAKVMMMIQAMISLAVIALLAARAVNML